MNVAGRVESHHRLLVSQIRTVSETSGRSVLAIGDTLSEVVDCAQEVKTLVQRLQLTGPSSASSVEDVARPADAFGEAVASAIGSSKVLLERAHARAVKVGDACDELLMVTGMCRTLVMHTRIESARMGTARGGISTTGEHMNAFTTQMVEATLQAQEVQGDLVRLLDDLASSLTRVSRMASHLEAGLDDRLRDMAARDRTRLALFRNAIEDLTRSTGQLVERSTDAVSALQFQDRAVQRLQRLDSLAQELRSSLGGSAAVVRWANRLGDNTSGGDAAEAADLAARAKAFRDDVERRTDEFDREAREAMQAVRRLNTELRDLSDNQSRAGHDAVRHAYREDLVVGYLNQQLREIDQALARYQALASEGEALCERILSVQRAISRVARRAETPALNVSLQASKAGDRGRPMAVIANEMVVVSRQVATSTLHVEEHASVLLDAIPGLQQGADELVAHGRACVDEVAHLMAATDARDAQTRAELKHALEEIERVRTRIGEATEVATEHFDFPRLIAEPLAQMRGSASEIYELIRQAAQLADDHVGATEWQDESENFEHDAGELILF